MSLCTEINPARQALPRQAELAARYGQAKCALTDDAGEGQPRAEATRFQLKCEGYRLLLSISPFKVRQKSFSAPSAWIMRHNGPRSQSVRVTVQLELLEKGESGAPSVVVNGRGLLHYEAYEARKISRCKF
jgi:hypothetical protein